MSVTDIIDGYFSGEKLESAWIAIDFFAEERAREYQRGLADVGAIPSQRDS